MKSKSKVLRETRNQEKEKKLHQAELPSIKAQIEKAKAELVEKLISASSNEKYFKIGDILSGTFSRLVFCSGEGVRSYDCIVYWLNKLNQEMDELRDS